MPKEAVLQAGLLFVKKGTSSLCALRNLSRLDDGTARWSDWAFMSGKPGFAVILLHCVERNLQFACQIFLAWKNHLGVILGIESVCLVIRSLHFGDEFDSQPKYLLPLQSHRNQSEIHCQLNLLQLTCVLYVA